MKKQAKATILTIVAVVLAAGTAGIVYLQNRDTVQLPQIGDVVTNPQQENTLGLHLTNEFAKPWEMGDRRENMAALDYLICENDNGYYFTAQNLTAGNIVVDTVCYLDKETGTMLPLCPRPNCIHNGNEFCTASTEVYRTHNALIQYGDYFYTTVMTVDTLHADGRDAVYHPEVIRYAPDGTEITRVCSFDTNKDYFGYVRFSSNPIIHRGYLWTVITCENVEEWESGGQYFVDPQSNTGGFEIVGVELAIGKTVKIFETYPDDPKTGTDLYKPPHMMIPDGDYLYFTYYESTFGKTNYSPAIEKGLNRISLLTGEIEHVDNHLADFVYQNRCYYTSYNKQSAQKTDLYCYNMETGEETSLGSVSRDEGEFHVVADGQYVYAVGVSYEGEHVVSTMTIRDYEGKVLYEQSREGYADRNLAVKDGKVYVMTSTDEVAEGMVEWADVAGLIAGSGKFQPLYPMMIQATPHKARLSAWH